MRIKTKILFVNQGLGVGQEFPIPDFSNLLQAAPDSAVSTPLGLYRKWRNYVPTIETVESKV